jgi:cold shock CspA family protein
MVVGQVKWFNAKAGFGFVTVGGGDVFVHHSEVKVRKEQFRYLVEGEYVELKVSKMEGGEKSQGSEITGVGGGRLMCEVRAEASEATNEYKATREPVVRRSVNVGGVARERERERESKQPRARVKKSLSESVSVVQQMGHKPRAELE